MQTAGIYRPSVGGLAIGIPLSVAAYVALAVLAQRFSIMAEVSFGTWNPAIGFALGALVVFGSRFGLAAVAGEAIAGAVVLEAVRGSRSGRAPVSLVEALVEALAVVGPYVVAAAVLRRRLQTRATLRTARTVGLALALGVGGATTAAALGRAAVRVWTGSLAMDEAFAEARLWWLAAAIGVLAVGVPLLVLASWISDAERAPLLATWQARLLASCEVSAVLIMPFVAFSTGQPGGNRYVYLVLLSAGLVAFRHGLGGACAALVVTVLACTIAAHAAFGGVVGRTDLQALLLVLSASTLVIGGVVADRTAADRRLLALARIVDATTDVVAIGGPDLQLTYVNAAGRRVLGLSDEDTLSGGAPLLIAQYGPPEERERFEAAVRLALEFGPLRGDATLHPAGSGPIPVSQVVIAEAAPDGTLASVSVIARDLTAQREVEDELARRVLFDGLTGALLREPFEKRIAAALAVTPRYRPRVAVLVVDLERFRLVTDTLGHDAADEVLVTASQRARDWLPSGAELGRIAGAQLGILLPDIADRGTALVAAEALVQAIEGHTTIDDGRSVRLAAAVGVTMAQSADADPRTLLRRASLAAVEARDSGESRVAAFDDDLATKAQRRVALEADLREAIGGDDWRLDYQPVVVAGTGELVSAEALLRWTHPLLGPLPALEVARLAEETGLIVPLGRAILRRACADAGRWNTGRAVPISVGVNVSVRQLGDLDFEDDVVAALSAASLDPARLLLEVTETALMDDPALVTTRLRRLKAIGVTIALDDFGTGYSSLASLRDLPIDVLKLDASFLLGLSRGGRAATFTAAVLAMANALGLTVTAEGVESEDHARLLHELGCHRLQGYLVGRPASSEALLAYEPVLRDRSDDDDDGDRGSSPSGPPTSIHGPTHAT